jgi:hypothetical protein
MKSDFELELNFSDITLCETEGIFKDVMKKMISLPPYNEEWMIRTKLTIGSEMGIGEMILHFYGNGKIIIKEYITSIGDVFYNPDIQCLSMWAQENGWKIPQPDTYLIKQDKEFWKHFYDTLIIDSDYFDKIYGKRPQLEEMKNDKKKNRKKRN